MQQPIIAPIVKIELIGKKKKINSSKIIPFPVPPPDSDRQFLLQGANSDILVTLGKPTIREVKKRICKA